jgi:hypothetical protein
VRFAHSDAQHSRKGTWLVQNLFGGFWLIPGEKPMRLVTSVPVTEQPFTGTPPARQGWVCPAGQKTKKLPFGKIS